MTLSPDQDGNNLKARTRTRKFAVTAFLFAAVLALAAALLGVGAASAQAAGETGASGAEATASGQTSDASAATSPSNGASKNANRTRSQRTHKCAVSPQNLRLNRTAHPRYYVVRLKKGCRPIDLNNTPPLRIVDAKDSNKTTQVRIDSIPDDGVRAMRGRSGTGKKDDDVSVLYWADGAPTPHDDFSPAAESDSDTSKEPIYSDKYDIKICKNKMTYADRTSPDPTKTSHTPTEDPSPSPTKTSHRAPEPTDDGPKPTHDNPKPGPDKSHKPNKPNKPDHGDKPKPKKTPNAPNDPNNGNGNASVPSQSSRTANDKGNDDYSDPVPRGPGDTNNPDAITSKAPDSEGDGWDTGQPTDATTKAQAQSGSFTSGFGAFPWSVAVIIGAGVLVIVLAVLVLGRRNKTGGR